MNEKRNKPDFGMDGTFISKFDWPVALGRIQNDVRTDFIHAPHISSIYSHAAESLADQVRTDLTAGRFAPNVPITIEVPKSNRMRVAGARGVGPSFSRPGSILLPKDRLLYQLLADEAAATIELATDRTRAFSHRLADAKSAEMFLPNRTCWSAMQERLASLLRDERNRFVIKADVANCFASINQHTLIKALESVSYAPELRGALENMLVRFTTDRSSRGIIQGIFPSDLFGDFYMTPVDQFLSDSDVPSVRYVDDIYVFLPNIKTAHQALRGLTDRLRSYDLVLNESKSYVLTAKTLLSDEPDLDALFQKAINDYREFLLNNQDVGGYGFQATWQSPSAAGKPEETHEVEGLEVLFSSIPDYPSSGEQIERFCLPLLSAAGSDYAVDHVLEHFTDTPSMCQFYCAYLERFIKSDREIAARLASMLNSDRIVFDWQRMWIVAALTSSEKLDDEVVRSAQVIALSGRYHETLRAVAMPLIAKHGSYIRRKALIDSYSNVGSPYSQSALLYSARYFPSADRRNAQSNWSAHNELNRFVAEALPALTSIEG